MKIRSNLLGNRTGHTARYAFSVFAEFLPLPARDERGRVGEGESEPHLTGRFLSPALSSRSGGAGEEITMHLSVCRKILGETVLFSGYSSLLPFMTFTATSRHLRLYYRRFVEQTWTVSWSEAMYFRARCLVKQSGAC